MNREKMKTCCFIGHRKINETEKLYYDIKNIIENLLINGVSTFLFGSRSRFDYLCWKIVTDLKEKYPHLMRVYIRAEYEFISKDYENYILESYEQTYFSKKASNANAISYVIRNQEMIDKSDICIFYYDKSYKPSMKGKIQKSSGTKLAFDYSAKRHKTILNIFDSDLRANY